MPDNLPLYEKFRVTRKDGRHMPGEKHHNCRYFVLDLDHDPFVWQTLLAYADECEEQYPELAQSLREAARTKNPSILPYEQVKDQLKKPTPQKTPGSAPSPGVNDPNVGKLAPLTPEDWIAIARVASTGILKMFVTGKDISEAVQLRYVTVAEQVRDLILQRGGKVVPINLELLSAEVPLVYLQKLTDAAQTVVYCDALAPTAKDPLENDDDFNEAMILLRELTKASNTFLAQHAGTFTVALETTEWLKRRFCPRGCGECLETANVAGNLLVCPKCYVCWIPGDDGLTEWTSTEQPPAKPFDHGEAAAKIVRKGRQRLDPVGEAIVDLHRATEKEPLKEGEPFDLTRPLPPCPKCNGKLSCMLGTPHGNFIWCTHCGWDQGDGMQRDAEKYHKLAELIKSKTTDPLEGNLEVIAGASPPTLVQDIHRLVAGNVLSRSGVVKELFNKHKPSEVMSVIEQLVGFGGLFIDDAGHLQIADGSKMADEREHVRRLNQANILRQWAQEEIERQKHP